MAPLSVAPTFCSGGSARDARRWAARLLAGTTDTPRLDAEVLLTHVLGISREILYAQGERRLSGAQAKRYTELVRRRLQHEPVAYLIGHRAFYDVELSVDPRVLIPRPETELLIEMALDWSTGARRKCLRVVDVGTGSGALAIVLARHLPEAQITATDISREALRVAAINVRAYRLQGRISLVQADLLVAVAGPLDLIVANPPYVPQERLPTLPEDVRVYEPMRALDGGADGLEIIQELLRQAAERLARPGLFLTEIDATQRHSVRTMATRQWPNGRVNIVPDYAGMDRVLRVELL